MRTADLTGALLDYWVARAEGIDAKDLTIRNGECLRQHHDAARQGGFARAMNYSTNWALCGPLMEKHGIGSMQGYQGWYAENARMHSYGVASPGPTPSIAICRAVVRAAFGDQVEDLEVVS